MREPRGAQASTIKSGAGISVTDVSTTYGVCCDFRCGQ
jgi:hypothetical protein